MMSQSRASEVKFGFDQNGCFTKTPDDIKGSYEGCYKNRLLNIHFNPNNIT